jgi:hypothetical protein
MTEQEMVARGVLLAFDQMRLVIAKVKAEERERCAKLAEEYGEITLAAEIRENRP